MIGSGENMIVSVEGVEFKYKSTEILKDVKFEVEKGEVVSILGINGAGKSTLIKCINKILPPKKGTITVENLDVNKMDRLDLAKKVGYVPQRSNGNYMTVFDALLLGRKPHIKWEISKKDIEITENVTWLGQVDNTHEIYNATDVFVLTSIYEGFGLVLLEAIDSGLPIVAANNSSIPEVLGRSHLGLFENESLDSLVATVVELLSSPTLVSETISNQFLRLPLFSVENYQNSHEAIYLKFLF